MNPVKTSIEAVITKASFVRIDTDALSHYATIIYISRFSHWLSKAPYDLTTLSEKDRLGFIAVLDAISFSYWGEPKWTIEYQGTSYDGAYALNACLGQAHDEGVPILDPTYLESISIDDLEFILKGNTQIPLLDQRKAILQEFGRVTNQIYDGDIRNLIGFRTSAVDLMQTILHSYHSFTDQSQYGSNTIFFNKRAQLLVSDMHHILGEESIYGTVELSACADYKLPQILRKNGILVYEKKLADAVDSKHTIASGSAEEVEIRAATIYAVDLLTKELQKKYPNLKAIEVNDYLWLQSQQKHPDDKPYHRTRTTAY